MDEVFDSSLDVFGTDEFLKIIKFVIRDANIFVISHKSDLHDKFDSVIKFDKLRGFSSIVSQESRKSQYKNYKKQNDPIFNNNI